MNKVTSSILFIVLISIGSKAWADCSINIEDSNICMALKIKENIIIRNTEHIATLEQQYIDRLEAQRIRGLLLDPQNTMGIENLEDDKIKEMALMIEDRNSSIKHQIIPSVAGLMVASYLIRNLNKTTKGQAFLKRTFQHFQAQDRRFWRRTLSAALALSLATTVVQTYKIYSNKGKRDTLQEMLDSFASIKINADKLLEQKENLEEMILCFDYQKEILIENSLITLDSQDKIRCP
jgi:hypothetical protein